MSGPYREPARPSAPPQRTLRIVIGAVLCAPLIVGGLFVTIAPMVHRFGWMMTLAALALFGVVAGLAVIGAGLIASADDERGRP